MRTSICLAVAGLVGGLTMTSYGAPALDDLTRTPAQVSSMDWVLLQHTVRLMQEYRDHDGLRFVDLKYDAGQHVINMSFGVPRGYSRRFGSSERMMQALKKLCEAEQKRLRESLPDFDQSAGKWFAVRFVTCGRRSRELASYDGKSVVPLEPAPAERNSNPMTIPPIW